MSADADVPHGDVFKPQILIIRDDSAKLRLCIVRKASSRQLAQVRVSKPVYSPCTMTCLPAVFVEADKGFWNFGGCFGLENTRIRHLSVAVNTAILA